MISILFHYRHYSSKSSQEDDDDKKILDQVEKMLEKKTFLMHVSVNKLGTGFKGHMKDINELIHGEKDITLNMRGLTFSGDIKDQNIQNVKQNLAALIIHVPDEIDMNFTKVMTNYTVTGQTPYNYSSDYTIGQMAIDIKSEFNLLANDIIMQSTSTVKNGLLSGTLHTKSKSIHLTTQDKVFAFSTLLFDMSANNLAIEAFEKLEEIDADNEVEMDALLQELLSKGVTLKIPNFSIGTIEAEGQKMDGFELNAKIDIDKSFKLTTLEENPIAVASAIDANLNISLSDEFFNIVEQQPQAMIILMLFQPKDKNGKKLYTVEVKDGQLTINGTPML